MKSQHYFSCPKLLSDHVLRTQARKTNENDESAVRPVFKPTTILPVQDLAIYQLLTGK